MSLIDEAIRTVLLANTAVYNTVGTRIYPLKLPLVCTFPAVSYFFPSDPYNRIASSATLQIDCWALDYTECKNLKIAIEKALDGYSNTVLGINIEGIYPIDSRDQDEPDDTELFHIAYDFKVIYRR